MNHPGWLLRVAAIIAFAIAFSLVPLPDSTARAASRVTVDRPDDLSGNQVHVMYVLPSDGSDRNYDTSGALANSVSSFNRWLEGKTGGRGLRLDTFGGALDVTFFRLSRTDSEIAATGAFVRDEIEDEITAAGFAASDKIYAVYYDGTSTVACGGGAYPPTLPGSVAALYLKGAFSCDAQPFAGPGAAPGYREYSMLHEIVHTTGSVPACAPNHTRAGHVSDDPNDLMWAGDGPWMPGGFAAAALDTGNNDYFRHTNSSCLDFEDSGFLTGPRELLVNPGFELDANADRRPDGWSVNTRFTRSTNYRHSGTFSGRHSSTTNAAYSVEQVVPVVAGAGYVFAGRVNVPATTDAFTMRAQIQWVDSANVAIGSLITIRTYSRQTAGWDSFRGASRTAPPGAVRAKVRMSLSSLNTRVYVDSFSFVGP